MQRRSRTLVLTAMLALNACASPITPSASQIPSPSSVVASAANASLSPTAGPSRIVHSGMSPVDTGTRIQLADLSGLIVTDDFEDVFAMDVDGSNFVRVANSPAGPEFDGSWSPDGKWIAY